MASPRVESLVNNRAHWLSLFSATVHLIIGISGLFDIGPQFLPPSWVIISRVPGGDWIYPLLWTLTGIVAIFGVKYPFALRLGFRMSAILFLAWGIAGIPAWLTGIGGNIQGVAANLFIAGCALVLSYYVSAGVRSDKIDKQVEKLADQINHSGD